MVSSSAAFADYTISLGWRTHALQKYVVSWSLSLSAQLVNFLTCCMLLLVMLKFVQTSEVLGC